MENHELVLKFGDEHYLQLLNQCIHCGLCLQACPTYVLLGSETDSPRGRIALMRAASEKRIELDGALEKHLDLCLTCRSCESACPSGVQYGALLDVTRIAIHDAQKAGVLERFIRWLTLEQLMPHTGRLKILAWFGRLYRGIGAGRLVKAMRFLPAFVRGLDASIPPASYQRHSSTAAPVTTPNPRGDVAFFSGCIQEAFLTAVNDATLRVLRENGFSVHVPLRQTCCGAAHLHLADENGAKQLARKNIDTFFDYEERHGIRFGAIINNAGGCGSQLKEYAHLLRDDPLYAARAQRFTDLTRDISEFLLENQFKPPRGRIVARATYAESCHLRNAQHVVTQPREIIRSIPGIELVELSHPEYCCGSAGVYNITQAETAEGVLGMKMADIRSTRADMVIVSNTGCHLQLLHGAQNDPTRPRVIHFVELLDESYRLAQTQK